MQRREELETASHGDAPQAHLLEILNECQSVIDRYLPAGSSQAGRLADVRARLREGRLQLAVLGQFKRGKSTFLNSLLGAPYLPSAVIPVTALPTFIAWDNDLSIAISYLDGRPAEQFHASSAPGLREALHRFVAEEENPANRLGVSRVDVRVPAPILEGGIVLIDTPGIGSTHRHNTDAALKVLPECDAALFVVSVDPPITENEIAYLNQIRTRVAELFFVLNKTDLVDATEADQARNFMRRTLETNRLIAPEAKIFSVSARSALAARMRDDRSGFSRSGMEAVEDYLLRFLALEKMRALERAVAMKAAVILSEAESDVALQLRALTLPLEELQKRQRIFEDLLRPIEARRLTTRDLLTGERSRIVAELEARAELLRQEARARLYPSVDDLVSQSEPSAVEGLATETVAPAITDFFDVARAEVTSLFVRQSEATLDAHRTRIGELVAAVRQTAADLFELTLTPTMDDEKFHLAQEPYWVSERWAATILPDLRPMFDRVLGNERRRARRGARMKARIDELIIRNVENLRWSILRGLDDTFLRAASTLEARLDDAIAMTRAAIANAHRLREARSEKVEQELDRLEAGVAAIAGARAKLTRGDDLLPA